MTDYEASLITRRPTRDQVRARRASLLTTVASGYPMTVRQVYYQATVHGLVAKTEQGYERVQADLVLLRKSGELPQYEICPTSTDVLFGRRRVELRGGDLSQGALGRCGLRRPGVARK